MLKETLLTAYRRLSLRSAISLSTLFLVVVFYDEFLYAVGYAARPVMRADLGLTYAQIGLLMGLPHIINVFIEPIILLLGDTRLRKPLMVAGGFGLAMAMGAIAGAQAFWMLLLAEIFAFPCSGAFVTLSQATLMDINPNREAQMMARWSASGSLANLLAPLLLAGGLALGMHWRWAYAIVAIGGLLLTLSVWRRRIPQNIHPQGSLEELRGLLRGAWDALRNLQLLRWLALLQMSDLLLDVFTDYAALYFADVVGLNAVQTGLVLSLMMLAGLASDLVLIPLLEKFPGRWMVRLSAGIAIPLYAAFLVCPWPVVKIILVVGVKLSTIGWYSVMEGETFATVRGRSATVKAIGSLSGLAGGFIIYAVGWAAEQAGLGTAMWLLLLGPLSLLLFVPKPGRDTAQE